MGLITKLKALLGLEEPSTGAQRRGDVGVTVEREPDEKPVAENERVVKGVDEEPDTAPADVDEEVQSTVDTHPGDVAGPSDSAEPEPDAEAVAAEDEGAEPEVEPEAEPEEAAESQPLESVDGIGPAYAERLRNAGVEDTAALAEADADELAEAVDLSAKRIGRWIEAARSESE